MPYTALYYTPEGKLNTVLSDADIAAAYRSGKGLLLVDVYDMSEADSPFLETTFGFHHLAVEDCASAGIHPPKIDPFSDYLFIIAHGINHSSESDIVETAELCLFLGKNFLVICHNIPMYSVAALHQTISENPVIMERGADFLAHTLLDALVDNVIPTIDRMNEVADEIEEEVILLKRQNILDGILKLKRSAMKVQRLMTPQREVFNRLSRGEFPLIRSEANIFYRDVYDHIVRIEGLNQSILDRADNSLATYLSSVANRQNETMRVLSIVATIFMPLTLLAGIYGMNFQYMPELGWRWSYFVVLGVIVLVIFIMVWRFWASGWLTRKKHIAWTKSFVVEGKKLRGYFTTNRKRGGTPQHDA